MNRMHLPKEKVFSFLDAIRIFFPTCFNTVSYLKKHVTYLVRNLVRDQGVIVLFTGIDAAIASLVVSGTSTFATNLVVLDIKIFNFKFQYLDRYYPELGGARLEEKDEVEISDHYSARLQVRKAIRHSVSSLVGTIVSRPFTVIMVRKIAQHISGELKYSNFLCSFVKIGKEEGPSGLFSGLLPAIIADLITIWGVTAVRYGIERVLQRTGVSSIF